MHRSLARSPSSGGARTYRATGYESAPAAPIAAPKARPSSAQAGPAITSASSRFRQASAWRMIAIDQGGGEAAGTNIVVACWANDRQTGRPDFLKELMNVHSFIALWRINKGVDDGEFHLGFVINQPSAFQLSELFKKTSAPGSLTI